MGDPNSSEELKDPVAISIGGKVMFVGIILLFLTVVLAIFLHLNNRRRRNGQSSWHRFVFRPDNGNVVDPRRGLEASIIQSLPVVIYHPSTFKDDGLECAVCLSDFSQGEKVRVLPKCNHGFHLNCIDVWFHSHSTCPLCRTLVELESVETQVPEVTPEDGRNPAESWKEDGSGSSSSSSSLEENGNGNGNGNGKLVIDIPRKLTTQSLSSSSASPVQFPEEELKSPTATRLRSLKRLLSRGRGVIACSPSPTGVDVEQGRKIQSPKAPTDS